MTFSRQVWRDLGWTSLGLKEFGVRAQSLLTILDSLVNINGKIYIIIDKKENLHFDDEQEI